MAFFESITLLLAGSFLGGFLGALSGLGGGIIIIPLLVLWMGVDIHYAIGASLIAVIATSTGSSAAYVKEGYSNIRVGMFLETATCAGALLGVAIGSYLPTRILMFVFALVLIYSSLMSLFKKITEQKAFPSSRQKTIFNLDGSYPVGDSYREYHVRNIPFGYAIMVCAGILSGGLGLGAGTLKVVALDQVMGLPFKVSTTTSNFMIGVTAATSAGLYLGLGYIDPFLTAPVVLGVVAGSVIGVRLLPWLPADVLRKLFALILLVIATQMIYKVFRTL